jgi:hypothetical protein
MERDIERRKTGSIALITDAFRAADASLTGLHVRLILVGNIASPTPRVATQ